MLQLKNRAQSIHLARTSPHAAADPFVTPADYGNNVSLFPSCNLADRPEAASKPAQGAAPPDAAAAGPPPGRSRSGAAGRRSVTSRPRRRPRASGHGPRWASAGTRGRAAARVRPGPPRPAGSRDADATAKLEGGLASSAVFVLSGRGIARARGATWSRTRRRRARRAATLSGHASGPRARGGAEAEVARDGGARPDGAALAARRGAGVGARGPGAARPGPPDGSGSRLVAVLRGHDASVEGPRSRDGARLASGSTDGTVRVDAGEPGRGRRGGAHAGLGPSAPGVGPAGGMSRRPLPCETLRERDAVSAVAFTGDGACVASATRGAASLWALGGKGTRADADAADADAADADAVQSVPPDGAGARRAFVLQGHVGWVRCVACSSDAATRFVATGGQDRDVRVYDCSAEGAGACVLCLGGRGGRVRGLAFAPSDGVLASPSEDGRVRLWRLRSRVVFVDDGAPSGPVRRVVPVAHRAPLAVLGGGGAPALSAAFSVDGARLCASDEEGEVRVWALRGPGRLPPGVSTGPSRAPATEARRGGPRISEPGGGETARLRAARGRPRLRKRGSPRRARGSTRPR